MIDDSEALRRRLCFGTALCLLLVAGMRAGAQQAGRDTTKKADTTAQIVVAKADEPLFTIRDAAIAGGFAVATVALLPADTYIAKRLQNPNQQANRFFHHAATNLELLTSPGAYVVSGGAYLVGRLGHFDKLADAGLHVTAALAVAQGATNVIKGMAGRARPYVTGDTVANSFAFGRGFKKGSAHSSFPSGHTSTAFAFAAAASSEIGHWSGSPSRIASPIMYGAATLVGLSRMYHNKHWASDVAVGAAIGTFAGMKTAQYAHTHPRNIMDRLLLRTTVARTADGMAFATSIPWSP